MRRNKKTDPLAEPDAKAIQKEKNRGRELRKTSWWQNQLARGICHYCEGTFDKSELTMDHVIPLSRGGKSTRGNVVPCCKECNNKKQSDTPVDLILNSKPDTRSVE